MTSTFTDSYEVRPHLSEIHIRIERRKEKRGDKDQREDTSLETMTQTRSFKSAAFARNSCL